jgi:hypothetical protein
MNSVANFFLRAKHWQMFLVFALLGCIAIASMLITMLSHPEEALNDVFPFLAGMELFSILLALWVWSLGTFLNSVVPATLRMSRTFFRVAVIFVPLYIPIFGVFFQRMGHVRDVRVTLISYALIFPLHLFALLCQLYSLYFVSKALALAERGCPSSLPDYIGYFVGLWILPVGVWIIQPRINRLYAGILDRQTA